MIKKMRQKLSFKKMLSRSIPLVMSASISFSVFCMSGSLSTSAANNSSTPSKSTLNGISVTTYNKDNAGLSTRIYDTEFNKDNHPRYTSASSMQGLNVGTTFAYAAKVDNQKNNPYTKVKRDPCVQISRVRIGDSDPSHVVPATYHDNKNIYPGDVYGEKALGHCNELMIADGTDGSKYLFATSSDNNAGLAQMKVVDSKDSKGNEFCDLYLTGVYVLKNKYKDSNGTPREKQFCAGGISYMGKDSSYWYLLAKAQDGFYYGRIKINSQGGTYSNPTIVECYKVFDIDVRNALFSENGKVVTKDYLDTWINQGFYYSSRQDVIYVPKYNDDTKESVLVLFKDIKKNYINKFNFSDPFAYKVPEKLFPCNLSFTFNHEIESVGFRTGSNQSDLKLYFTINDTTNSYKDSVEGLWYYNCNCSTQGLETIKNSSSVVYTVKYVPNGGKLKEKETMNDTTHIMGIAARLRKSNFERSGYTFMGWNLSRKSDGKSLYMDKGTARWYVPGTQPEGAYLAVYADGQKVSQLTSKSGDVITCTAQWKNNKTSTGSESYYIDFNANGGTGTMNRQKIVIGQSTQLSKSSFKRNNYTQIGWYAYRYSDNAWLFDCGWFKYGTQPANAKLDLYSLTAKVSRTSSTDADLITMYAVWAPQYTVKYSPNGADNSKAMADTKHTKGITSSFRKNVFTKSGYDFKGWYLSRKSDGKKLYVVKGSTRWYYAGQQPEGAYLALYQDQQKVTELSATPGDVINCTAQWVKKPTNTKTFYVDFNSNGGTGTMNRQTIVFGNTKKLYASTFVRSGYKQLGWYAYRRSDNKWLFDCGWYKYGTQPANAKLDLYKDTAKIAKTSSYNCDVVTMYAVWQAV